MPRFARRAIDLVRMTDVTARLADRAGFGGFGAGSNGAVEVTPLAPLLAT